MYQSASFRRWYPWGFYFDPGFLQVINPQQRVALLLTLKAKKNKISCFQQMVSLMFFLYPGTKSSTPIILHIRGAINEKGKPGFVDGERIFLVKHTSSNHLDVIKQVGVVQKIDGQLSFHYTDDEFKKVINYKEDTGYSTMDGADWKIRQVNYLNNKDISENKLSPNKDVSAFMYSSAKKPFIDVGPSLNEHISKSFFSKSRSSDAGSDNELNPAPSYGPLRNGYR